MSDEDRMMQDRNLKWSSASIINNEKRTIHINGVKLGFNNAVFLLDLINSTHEKYKKEDKYSMSCISIKKQLSEYLAQWENVQLGDIVKYRGGQ